MNIGRCHLATHSTGGIIAARMLLAQPERFGKVLALDPVTPLGLSFSKEQIQLFESMRADPAVLRSVMATAASALFSSESLLAMAPVFRDTLKSSQELFDRLVEQTRTVADGIWMGTPINLNFRIRTART